MLEDLNRALDVVFSATGLRSLDDGNVAARVPKALRVPSTDRLEARPESYRCDALLDLKGDATDAPRLPESYRCDALLPDVPVGAVEAGTTCGWHHLVGDDGAVIGLDRFGLSGSGEGVYEELDFIVDAIREVPEPASGRATTA